MRQTVTILLSEDDVQIRCDYGEAPFLIQFGCVGIIAPWSRSNGYVVDIADFWVGALIGGLWTLVCGPLRTEDLGCSK